MPLLNGKVRLSFKPLNESGEPPMFPEIGIILDGTNVLFRTYVSDRYLRENGFTREEIGSFVEMVAFLDSFGWDRDASMRTWIFLGRRSLLKVKVSDEVILPYAITSVAQ